MTFKVVNIKSGEKYDIYIGRPSRFGNPFSHRGGTLAQVEVETREEAIECFENYVRATPWLLKAIKEELKVLKESYEQELDATILKLEENQYLTSYYTATQDFMTI